MRALGEQLRRKEGGEEQGGRMTERKRPLLLETLQEFTMWSVTPPRSLDLVVCFLLPFTTASRIIFAETQELQIIPSVGKALKRTQVAQKSGGHDRRDTTGRDFFCVCVFF